MPGTEQVFKSPNFYEREIDKSAPTATGPVGTPAGIIGTAKKGPAFVPVTVASMGEFVNVFGNLDPTKFGPYAVNEFLKNRTALTYLRVLNAGANSTITDISNTQITGRVKNTGFHLAGNSSGIAVDARNAGAVQLLTARGAIASQEAYGLGMFTDNSSFNSGSTVDIVRGIVILASGARLMVASGNMVGTFPAGPNDAQNVDSSGYVKLIVSSALGSAFCTTDGLPGLAILTASFNPTDPNYYGKILNTDPDKFVSRQHLLWVDFAVDAEVFTASIAGVLSGSANASTVSGQTLAGSSITFRETYGSFDTRYTTPKTPMFISQPFGATEYDLFKFEAIDDGRFANNLYKVSITNIQASTDSSYLYGKFTVQIRDWNDTDFSPNVLEQFPNCTLDPNSDSYIGKLIGDRKVAYNFDATTPDEKRLYATGKYSNLSKYVRVVIPDAVDRAIVPQQSLPFGFRGMELLKTNDILADDTKAAAFVSRLAGVGLGTVSATALTGSIIPPIPFRFKVTKGTVSTTSPAWPGMPGPTELANTQLYWGVKFERNNSPLNPNLSTDPNTLLSGLTKFTGIKLLDTLVTGSGADAFNNNKFTLSRVALANGAVTDLTSSVSDHMLGAAYIRNGKPDTTSYTVNDGIFPVGRITFATILAKAGAAVFNKFSTFTKFTTFMNGGWDGTNILDPDARRMNDKSTSFDVGGGALSSFVSPGLLANQAGSGQNNSTVMSYKSAIDIMTDPMTVNTNVLAIPGIRESYITDYASLGVRNYGLAFYVMDIPSYDDTVTRLYDDSTTRPSVDQTASQVDARVIDNNYVGTYFPDVFVQDNTNKRRVKVPASVAALGALGFNDRVAYPWFAPAGFNRAALDFVTNVAVRLNISDRDRLQDSRINPIATFPKLGFVIYGQKTLQMSKSALDRVNVRRLLLEIKRTIIDIANHLVFEQNTPDTRNKFVAQTVARLGLIQSQAGIEAFKVVCNETNNTQQDVDLNRMNGRIVVVPTRAVEYIALDFIITNSGVQFV